MEKVKQREKEGMTGRTIRKINHDIKNNIVLILLFKKLTSLFENAKFN